MLVFDCLKLRNFQNLKSKAMQKTMINKLKFDVGRCLKYKNTSVLYFSFGLMSINYFVYNKPIRATKITKRV